MTSSPLLLLVAFSAANFAAQAAITRVGSSTALNPNDFVYWGSLGPESSVYQPFSITSQLGLGVDVSLPNESSLLNPFALLRRDQESSWAGLFAPGEELLYAQGRGPLTFSFDEPVRGFGLQLQAAHYGDFEGSFKAYDSDENLLVTFDFYGFSKYAYAIDEKDSALYVGGLSDDFDISRVSLGLADSFAVSQVELVTGNAQVPEPSTVVGGLALACIAGSRLVRRKR